MPLNVRSINNIDIPELGAYRTLRRSVEHLKKGLFVAEGEKIVRRLLDSDITIISMLMTPNWFEEIFQSRNISSKVHNLVNSQFIDVFLAEKSILETIVGYSLHQGIMALAKVPNTSPLLDTIKSLKQPYLLLAMDGLVNAENVGVIVRNCAAFGVDAIIVGETSCSPYLRRAVRNSMGAVFNIPIIHSNNLVETFNVLRMHSSLQIVAAHTQGKSVIYNTELNGNICLVLGNEDKGVSKDVLEVCDVKITIPMMKNTDSLNVANASAVFLYEVRRQRIIAEENFKAKVSLL